MWETYKIIIDSEDCNIVERKYFEHAAMRDCVAFLMKDDDVNQELLDKYVRMVGSMYYELEKSKRLLSKKYEPQELRGKSYDYFFDFEEETITYVKKAD
jgi:hypothetical protein